MWFARPQPILTLLLSTRTTALLTAFQNASTLLIFNDRLTAAVNKSTGAIYYLTLDNQDLLGTLNYVTPTPGGSTGSGNSGIGPYLDCYCIPSGSYTPGSIAPTYQLITSTSTSLTYAGIVMSEIYPPTGQLLEQYWFLRDGETGLHTFSRLAYHNASAPFLRNLQEFRTLFRPNTPLWTHLITNKEQHAPLPSKNATSAQVVVQDATWYLGNTPEDEYVQQEGEYFSKYIFQDTWRDHDVHGLYADGSESLDGSVFGAWLVMNTRDTYFGGPTWSDLTVDGIVYNYIVSNHHGNGVPNITDGFDRTFGPQYYYFNKAAPSTPMETLRKDALQFFHPTWNEDFYDSIAQHVPNYVPSIGRTTWNGHIDLPDGAKRPIAVLSKNGFDFQDNAVDTTAYQYWADIDAGTGDVSIPAVKAGTYRLTVYADGIFGQYIKDDVQVVAGEIHTTHARWREENTGTEIWRIGVPDKSSGEYRHGYAPDEAHPLRPAQYRNYWAVHDFPTDFPDGVVYTVGKSDEAVDLNYVHWSVFGGYANSIRTRPYWENVNNWTILWDLGQNDFANQRQATFTVQLAGAKTAAGNTDVFNVSEPYANLPYTVVVNGHELEPWIIPYYHSSSCAVRSAVTCYNIAHKFTFDPKFFVNGTNELILSLPANATDYESAVLPQTTYVQYDALRLEIV
ncbi:putative rhamnogalacturonate lyase B [Lachnellula suecica]|uniref:rhamnogalacturonan endolyase n=1 Tax=Lachnellula suecica TaxID=602035 RepID=A0A8T9CC42_9HELO|nr:putative rhamnogalacturonate lyase B [Lachnellula suecica]